MKSIFVSLLFLLPGLVFAGSIQEKTVLYRDGDTILEGFAAWPDTPESKAGILIIHEWTGLGDYVKRRARQLASMGYAAFAVDIYGQGVRPQAGAEAGKIAGYYKSNPAEFRHRAQLGLDQLRNLPNVDPHRLGAMGYCFGGTGALELARSGADVKAVVSFHGGLGTKEAARPETFEAEVLVLHGSEDPHVPAAEVEGFLTEMKKAGVTYTFTAYSGAVHAFTNPAAGSDPSRGAAYDARADRLSFAAMARFFRESLRK